MDSLERFGGKLRALRKHHKVTLRWLAAQLGYTTHSYISEIESGQKSPTVVFVLKVSYLFGVTTDQLLKDELEVEIEKSQIRAWFIFDKFCFTNFRRTHCRFEGVNG